jgi:uncharacterized protein YjbI with pentapeptide repeats
MPDICAVIASDIECLAPPTPTTTDNSGRNDMFTRNNSGPTTALFISIAILTGCLWAMPATAADANRADDADPTEPTPNQTGGGESSESTSESNEDAPIPVGIDLLPYVGTSSGLPYTRRLVSFNLIGGISGGIDAVELGGALNLTRGDVRGAQLSGAANLVLEDVSGMQASGAINIIGGNLSGAQFAGAANIVGGNGGSQLSGAVNIAGGRTDGAQLAGAVNVTGTELSGLQATGAVNIAGGAVRGLQTSGAVNIAGSDVTGAQLGVANISGGQVDGLQLGVVNIAENSTASIGLISILADGFFDLEVYGSEEGLLMSGVRHGGDHIYNVYSIGAHAGSDATYPAFALGIGWRHDITEGLEFSTDILGVQTFRRDFRTTGDNNVWLTKLRPMLTWRLIEEFALFGGPTLTFARTGEDVSSFRQPGPPWRTWEIRSEGPNVRAWPGLTLGLRLL